MPEVKEREYQGGSGLAQRNTRNEDLADHVRSLIDDNTQLRAAITALTQKLDADAGVTDTDYESVVATSLGTQNLTKG